jgi:hypothetical protein
MRAAIRLLVRDMASLGYAIDPEKIWTAEHELEWIDEYAEKRPDNALIYCEMILRHGRYWDDTVNVGKLLLCVALIRDRLSRRDVPQVQLIRPEQTVVALVS